MPRLSSPQGRAPVRRLAYLVGTHRILNRTITRPEQAATHMRIDPLWTRAPLVLRSHLGAALGIVGAVVVLTVASASSQLLVSSAGSAAFERVLAPDNPETQGLVAVGEGAATTDGINGVDQLLRDEVVKLPQLAAPAASLAGMQFQRTPETAGVRGEDGTITTTLVYRDGLLPIVRDEAGSTGTVDGVCFPTRWQTRWASRSARRSRWSVPRTTTEQRSLCRRSSGASTAIRSTKGC